MAGSVDLQEFVVGFVMEAEEYLDSVNRNLVAVAGSLKQNRAEPRAVRELFRSLHTIKGLASMVGADPIVAISHEMESLLRTAERAGGRMSESTLDLLLKGTRALEERVRATSERGIAGIPAAPKSLLEALAEAKEVPVNRTAPVESTLGLPEDILRALSASEREQLTQTLSSNRRAVLIGFEPSAAKAAEGFNITSVRERLSQLGDIIKVVPRSAPGSPTGIEFSLLLDTVEDCKSLSAACGVPADLIQVLTAITAPEPLTLPFDDEPTRELVDDWIPADQSSVRVDIRRLDEALEQLSELVVTRSKLTRAVASLAARGVDTRELTMVLIENTRQLKRMRAAITKARMVPLAELLQRLPLVVRGLTKDTDKSVHLVIQVGLSEVDKAVADKIFPAIVHLIRNAVDHAVETKTERRRLGKPETATLSVLSDDSSGTNLVLTVRDDGRGIDRERVASKAKLPVARSDEELLQQITIPGMSTRDDVTLTSGRGMGMDIVRRTIEMLGGGLRLESRENIGTVFTMHVPVSVTIVDILSFESAGQVFAVPVAMVAEILEVDEGQLVKSPTPRNQGPQSRLIHRRGEAIPFFALDAVLYQKEDSIKSRALVVHQHRGGAIAFGVDRMLGQQEVVVRPLDDILVRGRGMAGATDLGDGRPTLVLDLATMGAAIQQNIVRAL